MNVRDVPVCLRFCGDQISGGNPTRYASSVTNSQIGKTQSMKKGNGSGFVIQVRLLYVILLFLTYFVYIKGFPLRQVRSWFILLFIVFVTSQGIIFVYNFLRFVYMVREQKWTKNSRESNFTKIWTRNNT